MILKKIILYLKNKKFVSSQSTFSKILEDNAYKKIPFALSKGKMLMYMITIIINILIQLCL